MIFVDENSDEKDLVIRMLQGPESGEERFLVVDLEQGASDFLDPEEFTPARIILNVPKCLIQDSSMEISKIKKTSKLITKSIVTLRNTSEHF